MSTIFADRVMETTSVTGTGAATGLGAVPGFQRFSTHCSVGDTFDYVIYGVDGSGVANGEWESGRGTYSAANTITRTTPVDGSSGPSTPVTFSAGTKHIMLSNIAASESAVASNAASALASVYALDQTKPKGAPWTIPLVADFTTFNLDSMVLTDNSFGIGIKEPGTSPFEMRGGYKAAPYVGTTAYSVYMRMEGLTVMGGDNSRFGVLLYNSTTGRMLCAGWYGFSGGRTGLSISRWLTQTSFYAQDASTAQAYPASKWIRVDVSAGATPTISLFMGDGYNWLDTGISDNSFVDYLGAPDKIGFGAELNSAVLLNLNSFSTTAPVAGGGGASS